MGPADRPVASLVSGLSVVALGDFIDLCEVLVRGVHRHRVQGQHADVLQPGR